MQFLLNIIKRLHIGICFILLLQQCSSMPSNSKFSNLETIRELKSKQISQLLTPMKDALDEEILLYNLCIEIQQEKQQKFEIFGPFYKFNVEGVDIKLECSTCLPKGYPISWSKITFENFQTEVMKTDGYTNPDLILKSTEVDLSTYYCSWMLENKTEIITNIWTLEIIPARSFGKVPAINWNPKDPFIQEDFTIQFLWKTWSDCNKCGTAGKRHRLGFCLIQLSANKKFTEDSNEYLALNVYPSLSCSLFLTFHPEISSVYPEIANHLAELPKMMIGYCKLPCDYIDFNPDERFQKLYPEKLRLLYRNESSTNEETEGSLGSNEGKRLWALNAKDFLGGLKDIPITTDYIPEIFAILSLFVLQLYILIQVYRNRAKAQ